MPKMIPLLNLSKFISLFLFCSLQIKTQFAQSRYVSNYCYQTGSYTENGSYKTNLDYLLSVLRYRSFYTGFYNYTSGSFPDAVYGTFLCRGDIRQSVCYNCVLTASETLVKNCTVQKEAIIWYEECMVRYSNRLIFSVQEDRPYVTWDSFYGVTYRSYLNETLDYQMDQLIREAYSGSSYFAEGTTRVAFLGEAYDLHCLVQCTPDLTPYYCNRCLRVALNNIDQCCYGSRWALVYTPNCMLKYETSFLAPPPPPPLRPPPPPLRPPPPPPPPPPPDVSDSGLSFSVKISERVVRVIVIPVAVSIFLLLSF